MQTASPSSPTSTSSQAPLTSQAVSHTPVPHPDLPCLLPYLDTPTLLTLNGRLMSSRAMGRSWFGHILTQEGLIQLYSNAQLASLPILSSLSLGQHVRVIGTVMRTRAGELTLRSQEAIVLTVPEQPLPHQWQGVQNEETRQRSRHLDTLLNVDSRNRFLTRSRIVQHIREFLYARDYLEVETPILQPVASGAAATPFTTHCNALDQDFCLRIAPEFYLERCVIGGMDRVFELGRNFRNEGMSRRHHPEFTSLELYRAYASLADIQVLTIELIQSICDRVIGSRSVNYNNAVIDFNTFRTISYVDLINEYLGHATGRNMWFNLSIEEQYAAAAEYNLPAGLCSRDLTHWLYSHVIEPTLVQPTFVTRLPAYLCPLARRCEDDREFVDVFELVIGGMEVAPAYQQQYDRAELFRDLEAQSGGEAVLIDNAFLNALETGLPPCAGLGVGIDRLCMILTGAESIRDVVMFPLMRTT